MVLRQIWCECGLDTLNVIAAQWRSQMLMFGGQTSSGEPTNRLAIEESGGMLSGKILNF